MKYSERPLYPLYDDEGNENDTGDPNKPTSLNWQPAGSPALNYNPRYQKQPVLQQLQPEQGQTSHLYVGRPSPLQTPGAGDASSRLLRSNMDGPNNARENWGQPVGAECKQ